MHKILVGAGVLALAVLIGWKTTTSMLGSKNQEAAVSSATKVTAKVMANMSQAKICSDANMELNQFYGNFLNSAKRLITTKFGTTDRESTVTQMANNLAAYNDALNRLRAKSCIESSYYYEGYLSAK